MEQNLSFTSVNKRAPAQYKGVFVAIMLIVSLTAVSGSYDLVNIALSLIGAGLGIALYHASFGFAGAWRRAISELDMSGVSAQIVMLAIATILFALILPDGQFLGQAVGGAVAPVSISMMLGALIFGIGMQYAGGCASGTLFTAGGGSGRMMLVLVFFCLGGFWGSLDLSDWQQLPGIGSVSLARQLGWIEATLLQLSVLGAAYLALRRFDKRNRSPAFRLKHVSWHHVIYGPWPIELAAVALAVLNALTLVVAGHPWSITWAFALWTAKGAVLLGWDPATSGFWRDGFQYWALNNSIFLDSTSVMNIALILGAMLAAALAGKLHFKSNFSTPSILSAIFGGLAMGYGARLAYGCNIGAFFSGIASFSLHGWAWIVAAFAGNYFAVLLKNRFSKGLRT